MYEQIKLLSCEINARRYSVELMINAFLWHMTSPSLYEVMRKMLFYPLSVAYNSCPPVWMSNRILLIGFEWKNVKLAKLWTWGVFTYWRSLYRKANRIFQWSIHWIDIWWEPGQNCSVMSFIIQSLYNPCLQNTQMLFAKYLLRNLHQLAYSLKVIFNRRCASGHTWNILLKAQSQFSLFNISDVLL